MKLSFFTLAVISLSACATSQKIGTVRHPTSQQAICNTLEDCELLRAQLNARILELRTGPAPRFSDTLKDRAGNVIYLKYDEAMKYCEAAGGHLPSAREWAQFASPGRPSDILSIDHINGKLAGVAPREFHKINTIEPQGTDSFFRRNSYHPPSDSAEVENNRYISSSKTNSFSRQPPLYFYGNTGEIAPANGMNFPAAVRCVITN